MVGIYGDGYLAKEIINLLNSVKIPHKALRRRECVDNSISLVIDAGFPRDYLNKTVRIQYLALLRWRLSKSLESKSSYLYLGSYSSIGEIRSVYGRTKKEAENLVLELGGAVLRLGLVVDELSPGGRYQELLDILGKIPLTIRIPENWCPIFVTPLTDFLQAVRVLIDQGNVTSDKVLSTSNTKMVSLNSIMEHVESHSVKIRIPSFLMYVMERILFLLPFSRFDNLNSIMQKTLE